MEKLKHYTIHKAMMPTHAQIIIFKDFHIINEWNIHPDTCTPTHSAEQTQRHKNMPSYNINTLQICKNTIWKRKLHTEK